jgi:hypothetical protein
LVVLNEVRNDRGCEAESVLSRLVLFTSAFVLQNLDRGTYKTHIPIPIPRRETLPILARAQNVFDTRIIET